MNFLNRITNYFLTTDGDTMILRVTLINALLVFIPVFVIPATMDWFGELPDLSRNLFFISKKIPQPSGWGISVTLGTYDTKYQ